jgi:RNase P subunit RPR2
MTATTQPLPIPLAPEVIPARTCEHCEEPLVRKRTRARPERPHEFAARRFCNSACAAHGLGAGDERVRLARLARLAQEWEEHENAIRERARRRVLATLTVEDPVEDPTGFAPGCVI